jgi:hypothetical protein
MDVFLDRNAFSGPSQPAPSRPGLYAGQAAFNGSIAVCNWARAAAAAALPADIELAPAARPGVAAHPVVFVLGEQTQGATIFGGLTFPMGVDYHEILLAIPFVKHRRGTNLHVLVARMYASFFPAIWAGNAHYGFGKRMATMRVDGARYDVTMPDGTRLAHAVRQPLGAWCAAAQCDLRNFAAMRAMFTLPVLGRREDGSYVASYFDWDFAGARVRPARVTVAIERELAPGFLPRACCAVPDGAFEVRGMIWRLSWPQRCRF